MKEKIEQEIRDLEEIYDYYLEEYYNKSNTLKYYEERIHDLNREINIYKKVLKMINKEELQ